MGTKSIKRPEYDGNACLLYDFMIAQHMTEEEVYERCGIDIDGRTSWYPVSLWIQHPESIPYKWQAALCHALRAPIEAVHMKSKILNGQEFTDMRYARRFSVPKRLDEYSSEELIREIKNRGYKVFQEVE